MKAPFVLFAATILGAVACGARTGLPVPKPPVHDAGIDAVEEPPVDAPPDVVDAGFDAPIEISCADAGIQFIYVITEQNELFSFYPPDNSFTDLGMITCPSMGTATPFSMGVNRAGIAYSVFSDGNLFVFDTGHPSTSCQATPYTPTQLGNTINFGMAFSADLNDPGETLYVASGDSQDAGMIPEFLGTIDTTAFTLAPVGQFPEVIGSAELTGTHDGRLFGFGVDQQTSGTSFSLVQIDKATAGILSQIPILIPTGTENIVAWAFAYYGGNFYFFTASANDHFSRVSLYTPKPGDTVANAVEVTQLSDLIVGAGVSTCAPM